MMPFLSVNGGCMENENYYRNEDYAELAQEVIAEHEDLHWLDAADVRIDFISSLKAKKTSGMDVYGECRLIKDIEKLYCPYDFLIIIYEQAIEGFTPEQLKILIYHELLHVDVDDKDGEPKYSINPHDIQDFRAVIDKYGLEWAK